MSDTSQLRMWEVPSSFPSHPSNPPSPHATLSLFQRRTLTFLFLVVGKLRSDGIFVASVPTLLDFKKHITSFLLSDSCLSQIFNRLGTWSKNNLSSLACLNCSLLIAPLLEVTSSSDEDSWNRLKLPLRLVL